MAYLVDTHALEWWLDGDKRLGARAKQALSDLSATYIVPAMVLIELVFLWQRQGVANDYRSALARLERVGTLEVVAIDEAVIDKLPLDLNIHDAVIVASGRVWSERYGERVTVLTKDAQIAASGVVDVLW